MRVFTDPNTPIPEVHLLSNGRYHVMATHGGGGYSRWRQLAVIGLAELLAGAGYLNQTGTSWLIKFIALNYGFFAVVQVIVAATSGIQNAIFKMFQWTLFTFVAVFAWVGTN